MTGGRANELFLARELPFDRPAGPKDRQDAEILGYHLLFPAEAATYPLGENVEFARVELEDMRELLLHDEWGLRAGPHMNPIVFAQPGDRAVRFQMDMLDPRRGVGHLVNSVRGRESISDGTDLAMDFGIDITLRLVPFIMENRGLWLHRGYRIEDCGQNFVVHPDLSTRGFCSGLALGDHRDHPLAHKA